MNKRRAFAVAAALLALVAGACGGGQPDQDFGTDGVVTAPVRLWDKAYDVAVQPDGKIVAVGTSSNNFDGSTGRVFSAIRLNPDGSLDTSFSGDGKVTVDFPGFANEEATAVVVLPSGQIVLGGQPYGGGHCENATDPDDSWLFAALNPDGTLNTSQGNQFNGTSVWHGSVFDEDIRLSGLAELVVDGDRFLIAGGNVVSRFEPSLFPDTTYGGRLGTEEGFKRVDDIPGETNCQTVYDVSPTGAYIAAKSHIYDAGLNSIVHFPGPATFLTVDVQPDGKILASGHFLNAIDPTFRARFLPDGTPDTTFLGTFGPWENNGYQTGAAQDFYVQGDGKIVVYAGGGFTRLNPNGTRDTSFGTNGGAVVPGGDAFFGGGSAIQPEDGKFVGLGDERVGDLDRDYWIGRFTA